MPYLKLQGRRINYQWYGETDLKRETAVFLHDGLGAIGSWKDIPEEIGRRAGINVLAYDRYGYGGSQPRGRFPLGFMEEEVPALVELLDALSLDQAHLVGHSDGASIALLCAARYPARVCSLVSVAAHTFVEPQTREGIQALVDSMNHGRIPAWLSRLHRERAGPLLKAWGSGWLTARHAQWNIESWLGYVKCPTLAIQGTADEFGTEKQIIAIMNRVEGCETWMVEGCGHTPYNEYPAAFAERVGGFLEKNLGDRFLDH